MKIKACKMPAIVLALGLILAGYSNPDNQDPGTAEGPDFTSHDTNYSILIQNNTNERLVAFKGELKAETLIGGIPAHAQNHGLPKDPVLFDKTGDFPLILLTETQYKANKDDLYSQRKTPFTRLFVFYNKSGNNTEVYEIAGCLGGNNTLVIINTSNSINVELRVNGVAGEILGYAPAGLFQTNINLQDGNYNIFPIFKRYNLILDTIETVYPKAPDTNYAWFQAFTFSGMTTLTLNLTSLLQE